MAPDKGDPALDAPAAAEETAVGAVSNWVGRFVGIITASGFAALIYAAGYIAVNRTGEVLGVPSSEPTAGTYIRGGYRFFLQSSAVITDVAFEFLTSILPATTIGWLAFLTAIPIGWLGVSWFKTPIVAFAERSRGKSEAVLVLALHAASAGIALNASQRAVGVLEADNLWFRAPAFVQGLNRPAQDVVRAIADNDLIALRGFYHTTMAATVASVGLLVVALLLESRVDFRFWRAPLRIMKWAPVAALVVLVVLLPSLYGICYLVPNSVCVSLSVPSGIPHGMLISEMGAETVEIVDIGPPSRLLRFKREDVASIALLTKCPLLPGFATQPAAMGKGP